MSTRIIFEKIPAVVIGAIIGFIGLFLGGIWCLGALGIFRQPVTVYIFKNPTMKAVGVPFKGPVWTLNSRVERLWRERNDNRVLVIHHTSPLKMKAISVEAWYGILSRLPDLRDNKTEISQSFKLSESSVIAVKFKKHGIYMGLRARRAARTFLEQSTSTRLHLNENERYEIWDSASTGSGMEILFPLKE